MCRYTLREISPLAWALAAVAALGVAILFVTTEETRKDVKDIRTMVR